MVLEPFRGSEAIASGRMTRGVLRSPGHHRLFEDIYVDASVTLTCAVWARAAYLLAVPSGGVLAGYAAAELLGASCGPWSAPAEILVAGHMRARPGLRVRRGTFAATDVGAVDGVMTTSPERTAWDLTRRLDLVEAVVAVDALAAVRRRRPTFVPGPVHGPASVLRSRTRSKSPGFDPAALLRRRVANPGARGSRRLDRVVELADPRAESPPETRLRLLLVLAGLPVPEVQYRLRDERADVDVRFDLAYPEAGLAIEYDGEAHDDALDRARDLRTAALGWHTLRLLRPDLIRTSDRTVAVVRDLRAERARLLASAPSGTWGLPDHDRTALRPRSV